MADRYSVYDYESKKKYDYDRKDREYEKDCDKAKEENIIKVDLDECINSIVIKPVVDIDVDIEGLENTMFVTNSGDKFADENYESINCIVIKPIVKVNINVSGLNTQASQ